MSRKQFYSFHALTILIIVIISFSCSYRSNSNSETPAAAASPVPAQTTQTPTADRKKYLDDQREDKGDFIVEYPKVFKSHHLEFPQRISKEKLLEKVADKLNRSLILPRDIRLLIKDCNETNAFYDAESSSITVCYELLEHFYKNFRADGLSEEKALGKMFDAVRFALLHEIGHALIDVYNLPITGNEEDAADRCAAFINLTELGADGADALIAAAEAFKIESKNNSLGKPNLADEHLLQEQRFYNSVCLLYGSDVKKYGYLHEENYLPPERAARCSQEYERTVNSWSSLLAAWRRD